MWVVFLSRKLSVSPKLPNWLAHSWPQHSLVALPAPWGAGHHALRRLWCSNLSLSLALLLKPGQLPHLFKNWWIRFLPLTSKVIFISYSILLWTYTYFCPDNLSVFTRGVLFNYCTLKWFWNSDRINPPFKIIIFIFLKAILTFFPHIRITLKSC